MSGFRSWSWCPCGGHPTKPKHRRVVNGWTVPTDAARAVGRFRPEGPLRFRAATRPDAPLRSTREAAEADEMAWRRSR